MDEQKSNAILWMFICLLLAVALALLAALLLLGGEE